MLFRFFLSIDSFFTCLYLPHDFTDVDLSCYLFYKVFCVEYRWPMVMRHRVLENAHARDRCYIVSWQERDADQMLQLQLFDARFSTMFCTMQWEDSHSMIVAADMGPPFGPENESNASASPRSTANHVESWMAETRPPSQEDVRGLTQLSPTQPQIDHSILWA